MLRGTQNLSYVYCCEIVHCESQRQDQLAFTIFFQDSCFLSELRGEIDSFSQKACLLQMMKFLSVEVVAVVVQRVLSLLTHRFLINDSACLASEIYFFSFFHTAHQMWQGHHRFSSLPKIQKELNKLIKNPKRFCHISNTTNVQGLRSKKI